MSDEELHEMVRRLRGGLTQAELAARMGKSDGAVAHWESGPAEGASRLGNTPAVFLGTYSHAAPEKDRPIANAIGAAIDAALDT